MINQDKLQELNDYLDSIGKWAEDYIFDNSDYGDNYLGLVCEDQIRFQDDVVRWVRGEYPHLSEEFGRKVWENLDPGFDSEAEAIRNEYSTYSGPGCCIGAYEIGEHEEQIDFSNDDVLTELHDSGELDDYLDEVNCDVYPCRHKRREKNENTGRYEEVGRETYNPYNRDHATLEVIVACGGQVQIVVPAERMRELVTETILQVASENKPVA